MLRKIAYAFFALLLIASCSSNDASIFGTWTLNEDKSTDIVTWRYRQLEMTIAEKGGRLSIENVWANRRSGEFVENFSFIPGGDTSRSTVTSQHWVENWYMGVLSKEGSDRAVWGEWIKPNKKLRTGTEQVVRTSQGETSITTIREFRINRKGNEMTVIEKRSSRPAPIKLVFDRKESL